MKIALLGSIPKGDDIRKDWIDWKEQYKYVVLKYVANAEFIDGDAISDNAGAELVVGHDLSLIENADLCLVDARSKIGAGTAQEIVIAKQFLKPVVIVIPKDSHHRKSEVTFHEVTIKDWVHPFLKISADYVADDIEDAAKWIKKYAESPAEHSIKDLRVYRKAIDAYKSSKYIH